MSISGSTASATAAETKATLTVAFPDGPVAFEALMHQGFSWSTIVAHYVSGEVNPDSATQEARMTKLVEYRDVIDHQLYQKAARELFPPSDFTVYSVPAGRTRLGREGYHEYVSRYYDLHIYPQPDQGFNHSLTDSRYCQITVEAAGSRTLTSDIDTTLTVENADCLVGKWEQSKLRAIRHADHNGAIRTAMIAGFYRLSEQAYGMTSGMSRDSRAQHSGG